MSKKPENPPSYEDASRCGSIRDASKTGRYIAPSDLKFCEEMFKKYPKWYASQERDVFERNRPVGSPREA